MDVEATTAVRQAEVTAAKTMLDRTADQHGVTPERLAADTGYGSAEMLAWLVDERGRSSRTSRCSTSPERKDGTFSRADFTYRRGERMSYACPAGQAACENTDARSPRHGIGVAKDNTVRYRASKHDCDACPLKPQVLPQRPGPQSSCAPSMRPPATGLADQLGELA